MKTSFYNTVRATHPELSRYEKKAVSQEEKILDYFKTYEQPCTPSKLCRVLFRHTPLTSVRRGLSNLTALGELVKTGIQKKGPYGRPEFQWRLANKYNQREMF